MAESEGEGDYKELVAAQNRKQKKSGGWQALGLDQNIFRGLTKKGYRAPTPIQRKAIPMILQGKDVVAMARTGSGKTAAFLVPILQKLKLRSAKSGTRALLISPTRELALQTFKFVKELGRYTGLRAAVLVGGDSLEEQFSALHESPDVLIATPGRLLHVVVEMKLKLSSVQYVVFDEADRLFEMGFSEQLSDVLKRLSEDRQTLLFSATLPKMLVDFARAGLTQPCLIRLDVDTKISDQLEMVFLSCRAEDKMAAFLSVVRGLLDTESQQSIVFVATKHHVEYVKDILEADGIPTAFLYSSMDPIARKINIAKFRNREANLLVATDVAARGVDIPLLDNAVNFHFPPKAKLFVHRVGRVARAGRSGRAISLLSAEEMPYLVDLFLFLGRSIRVVDPNNTDAADLSNQIGSIPQAPLDVENETLNGLHNNSADLCGQRKVAENAMKNYIKSRPLASSESVKRVKKNEANLQTLIATPESYCHPIFKEVSSLEESKVMEDRSTVLVGLKNYRPKLTIFETNTSNKNEEWVVMKRKRKVHAKYVKGMPSTSTADESEIKEEPEDVEKPSAASIDEIKETFSTIIEPKYRDPESKEEKERQQERKRKKNVKKSEQNASKMEVKKAKKSVVNNVFIPYRPTDFHSEQGLAVDKSSFDSVAKEAVLDFTADDGTDMNRQDHLKRWDRKKKKFVGASGNDKMKKIRTDEGTLVPASYNSGRYSKWVKKQQVEAQEESGDEEGTSERKFDWRKHGRRGGHLNVGGGRKGVKRELKRPDEILKERKRKERVQSYQKYRHGEKSKRKGRGGGSGKRGKRK